MWLATQDGTLLSRTKALGAMTLAQLYHHIALTMAHSPPLSVAAQIACHCEQLGNPDGPIISKLPKQMPIP
jgi:hypothetical protein